MRPHTMKRTFLLYVLTLTSLGACDGKSGESRPSPPPPAPVATVSAAMAVVPGLASAKTAPDAATLALGEQVYRGTCSICHQAGSRGAPRIGSVEDWQHRLDQGKEVLYERAIGGYRGKKGSMPSRGSNAKLSDAEVKAAVDYMYKHAAPAWSMQ